MGNELGLALEEAAKHLDAGRSDVKRQAFGQARQAFRRALAAVPDKLLLRQPSEAIARFAAVERASLLNQALCSLRLGEAATGKQQRELWEEVIRVCDFLLNRHLGNDELVADAVP